MAWDWDKLQQQKQGKPGSGGPPPQMDDILKKLKGFKGKFPGSWIILVLIIIVFILVILI